MEWKKVDTERSSPQIRQELYAEEMFGSAALVIIGDPAAVDHVPSILDRVIQGFSSWDSDLSGCDINAELVSVINGEPYGMAGEDGEHQVKHGSESFQFEMLYHPRRETLAAGMRMLLLPPTRYKHVIFAGYSFTGTGDWVVHDGTFSISDLMAICKQEDVANSLKEQQDTTLVIHVPALSEPWTQDKLQKSVLGQHLKILINPEKKVADVAGIEAFRTYAQGFINKGPESFELRNGPLVGNIRFSGPTVYVFPAAQGNCAVFGVPGFNMLLDGGFQMNSCFWEFIRHLDQLDALLISGINQDNLFGLKSFLLRRLAGDNVHPEITHSFFNHKIGKETGGGDGTPATPLSISLIEEAALVSSLMKSIGCIPSLAHASPTPIKLFHKIGHGSLDMYVLNPYKDSPDYKDMMKQWSCSTAETFTNNKSGIPLNDSCSIASLLVWKSHKGELTRILYPGSAPQPEILKSLEQLKDLEVLKYPSESKTEKVQKDFILTSAVSEEQQSLAANTDITPPPSAEPTTARPPAQPITAPFPAHHLSNSLIDIDLELDPESSVLGGDVPASPPQVTPREAWVDGNDPISLPDPGVVPQPDYLQQSDEPAATTPPPPKAFLSEEGEEEDLELPVEATQGPEDGEADVETSAAEEPAVAEEPTAEEAAAAEDPTAEVLVKEEPTSEVLVGEEPTAEEPAAAADEPAAAFSREIAAEPFHSELAESERDDGAPAAIITVSEPCFTDSAEDEQLSRLQQENAGSAGAGALEAREDEATTADTLTSGTTDSFTPADMFAIPFPAESSPCNDMSPLVGDGGQLEDRSMEPAAERASTGFEPNTDTLATADSEQIRREEPLEPAASNAEADFTGEAEESASAVDVTSQLHIASAEPADGASEGEPATLITASQEELFRNLAMEGKEASAGEESESEGSAAADDHISADPEPRGEQREDPEYSDSMEGSESQVEIQSREDSLEPSTVQSSNQQLHDQVQLSTEDPAADESLGEKADPMTQSFMDESTIGRDSFVGEGDAAAASGASLDLSLVDPPRPSDPMTDSFIDMTTQGDTTRAETTVDPMTQSFIINSLTAEESSEGVDDCSTRSLLNSTPALTETDSVTDSRSLNDFIDNSPDPSTSAAAASINQLEEATSSQPHMASSSLPADAVSGGGGSDSSSSSSFPPQTMSVSVGSPSSAPVGEFISGWADRDCSGCLSHDHQPATASDKGSDVSESDPVGDWGEPQQLPSPPSPTLGSSAVALNVNGSGDTVTGESSSAETKSAPTTAASSTSKGASPSATKTADRKKAPLGKPSEKKKALPKADAAKSSPKTVSAPGAAKTGGARAGPSSVATGGSGSATKATAKRPSSATTASKVTAAKKPASAGVSDSPAAGPRRATSANANGTSKLPADKSSTKPAAKAASGRPTKSAAMAKPESGAAVKAAPPRAAAAPAAKNRMDKASLKPRPGGTSKVDADKPKPSDKRLATSKSRPVSTPDSASGKAEAKKPTTKSSEDQLKKTRLPAPRSATAKASAGSASQSGPKGAATFHVELAYVPHHGNRNYVGPEYFERIHARYYVFSGLIQNVDAFDSLLAGKESWPSDPVTIITTYDTTPLRYWVAEQREKLVKLNITLATSASKCWIQLTDEDFNFHACRLEF